MGPDQLAIIWLFGLIIVACIYFWRLVRTSDYSAWESCLYLPTYVVGRLLWRVHFTNETPAALHSGGVLVANHRSSVDPFFVQLAARRRVHWMVAKEYCQHFAFGPLLRALEVIPTNRSGIDTASTKSALRLTQAGRLVGMFPEGRINQSSAPLLPLRSGAALVAIRSNVPLIPLWIVGSPLGDSVWSPLFMPARVTITFGEPIWPNSIEHKRQHENSEASTRGVLADSDGLIVQWAQQILMLADCASTPIELASQRKRRNRT